MIQYSTTWGMIIFFPWRAVPGTVRLCDSHYLSIQLREIKKVSEENKEILELLKQEKEK
ncbi:hypothetical protein [Bacillus tuaregi]|uniref:hypothetical protein n=1 Tax=Bacillus tuaregi TaxID=1816695 RepID=UPI0013562C31|nr:hypothetical protein [Bacillus tuaregi]